MAGVRRDIRFATHDGVPLYGDLYTPARDGSHPVVIAVPGGGWLRGDRAQLAHWGELFAEEGVGTFVVDYRRSTNGMIFPQNAADVLAAMKFVHAEASQLGIDHRRIGLLGASAGAHLAALALLAGETPLLARMYPSDAHASAQPAIRAFAGVYGVYDLSAHWTSSQAASPPDDMADRMMGEALPGSEGAYRAASPSSYVGSTRSALPVMLIWGDSDTTVAPAQSQAFAAQLSESGALVTTLPVAGAGHFWFSKDADTTSGFNGQVAPALIAFLQKSL